jgi:hypothetical protein
VPGFFLRLATTQLGYLDNNLDISIQIPKSRHAWPLPLAKTKADWPLIPYDSLL